ncbi:hypothetical protein TCEL_00684 [Thermobrachium celere DSM 8682]|uniref:Uncharacterized protein n=1 Tax=Thermobrachium celere DSM 8682 TaxID=941824 RepID=R7RTM4_9CLOT|nr:hypothetical protein TCEL_00684 [Thermobrachium celere DSM 8682]
MHILKNYSIRCVQNMKIKIVDNFNDIDATGFVNALEDENIK